MEIIKRLWKDEEGQGLVEYAILIGIIVVGVIVAVMFIGGWVKDRFGALQEELGQFPVENGGGET